MKKWLAIVLVTIISLLLVISIFYFTQSDTRGYAIIVELTDPYPDQYLPISELDLLSMPTLLFAMNETGVQKNLTQQEWQKIFDYMGASEEILEFAGDFYYITLFRV